MVGTGYVETVSERIEINEGTIEFIIKKRGGDGTKVINLIKSIEKHAEEESDDPFLIAMAERARAVQESFEDRQISTQDTLNALFEEIRKNEERKKEQAEKGFDGLTFFIYRSLLDAGIAHAEEVSNKIKSAFAEHTNWKDSEADLRELRQEVTFVIYKEIDDPDQVALIVENLFSRLQ